MFVCQPLLDEDELAQVANLCLAASVRRESDRGRRLTANSFQGEQCHHLYKNFDVKQRFGDSSCRSRELRCSPQ